MSEFRAFPRLDVFERLQVGNGLAIDAERWQQAHNYHRQRQNFHYQALFQPGIVYGLGVAPVPDQPEGRLLQIQPGVAIDIQGNPIVVPQPEEFRLESAPSGTEPLLVYLVVNHVDPDRLRRNTIGQPIRETFRIVEKLHLDPEDVELCRIRLRSGATTLHAPSQVFAPGDNQLDFRNRPTLQPQPQLWVQVGQITPGRPTETASQRGWQDLLRSLKGLYPALQGSPELVTVAADTLTAEAIAPCQLLQIGYRTLLGLPTAPLQTLKHYLAQGGVLLVVAEFADLELLELLEIGRELRLGLAEAARDRDLFEQTGRQLEAEIAANQTAIAQQLAEGEAPLTAIATQLGVVWSGASFSDAGTLPDDHPLYGQPFLFSQMPSHLGHPIYVKNWGGLVLMVGDLTSSWGRNPAQPVAREVLRSAQEWGVNLLHFAAQRWQWTQAMQPLRLDADRPNADRPTDTLRNRVQTM